MKNPAQSFGPALLAGLLAMSAGTANPSSTELATQPLVTSATTQVRPNIMYVLDDSGSMDRSYLPDWAGSYTSYSYLNYNSDFNGIYYNPAITYTPPRNYNADGSVNSTQYPSMTGISTSTGGDASASAASPNWKYVRVDGYGVQSTYHTNLTNSASYYLILPGEYCSDKRLSSCNTQSAPNTSYPYPAKLRWCNSSALSTCQALWISGSYTYPRVVTPTKATLTVSGSSSTSVSAVTVGATNILAAGTTATTSSSTLAGYIATAINNGTTGYAATASGSTVTLYAPSRITSTPTVTKSGSMTISATAFSTTPIYSGTTVPGVNTYNVITAGRDSYVYPGTAAKAPTRTDCAGTTCTYAEEMTNYANWYAYYHTRMQMMKTAASLAFSGLGDNFRVGYMTINNSSSSATGGDFLNIATFDDTQKAAWYAMFFKANPSGATPLRSALSAAGLVYGNAVSSIWGVSVTNPVSDSCQQNFTILSTDGYWNTGSETGCSGRDGAGCQLDKTSAVGQQDGSAARPYFDGVGALQKSTMYLQKKTKSGGHWGSWSSTSTCTPGTSTQCRYAATNSWGSADWSAATATWSTVTSCTESYNSNVSGSYSSGDGTKCQSGYTGTSDTLADVAYYYYNTSLRGGPKTGDCQSAAQWPCNVPTSGNDTATWQHMTTFTLGLGANGYMLFDPAYASPSPYGTGDYHDVAVGNTANGTSVCSWQDSGTICGWPQPSSDSQANIDDLWHAAVNGHGSYYSAKNPTDLAAGLSNALAGVSARSGSAAAATTSNPNVTAGDNFVFSSTFSTTSNPVVYTTAGWTGELTRQRINTDTGAIQSYDSSQGDWMAQALLDALVSAASDTRTIYTYDSSGGSGVKSFDWGNLTTAEQANFSAPHVSSLTQFCDTGTYTIIGDPSVYNCLSATDQGNAAGQNLVNFLRGQYQYEARPSNASVYYRAREHVLGDIVSSESVYVKVPPYNYTDSGYAAYKSAQSSRQGMVYVAANDGMLHAFNATNGQEMWAYVPGAVLPNLYRLADMNYKNNHRFFVDGTPIVGDAYVNGAWATLLVGGLGAGGAGFYALDVTNPSSPRALWEFNRKTTACAATDAAAVGQTSDCDLGYGYGNPVITKLEDGSWVVLLTSGYNNTSPGDAEGHLFVLDAATGQIVNKLSTGVGSNSTTGSCTTAPCPSGLGKIAAWVDDPMTNNTTLRVYGGDLFGYLYRFDVNGADTSTPARWADIGAAGYDVLQLAQLVGPNSLPQPITTKPELGEVKTGANSVAMVFVGTGSYLGAADLTDANQQSPNLQSFYGIRDALSDTGWGDIRGTNIVQQVLTTSGSTRTGTNNPVDLTAKAGWYVDLPDSGERDNTDSALALGTIVFNTNVPESSSCTIGGYSWQYQLDYRSGAPIVIPSGATVGNVANKLGNALATRPVLVELPNNTVVSLTKLSDTSTQVTSVNFSSAGMNARRVTWRELITE